MLLCCVFAKLNFRRIVSAAINHAGGNEQVMDR